jgi:hypothetical protein
MKKETKPNNGEATLRRPQYHDLIQNYAELRESTQPVDPVVTVFYRKSLGGRYDYCMEDYEVEGELLEVRPQGLCISADNDDGEVFVPFSQIQAFLRHEEKVAQEDLAYYLAEVEA